VKYQDFVVSIERDGPAAYRKRVLESTAGQGSDPFEPPFPLDGLSVLLDQLGPDVRSGLVPRETGAALYQALFSGQVGALYSESRGRAEGTGHGLRIKLRFDPNSSGMSWVPVLPWELIFRPDTEEFLGSDLMSPIVRYLEVPRSSALTAFHAPLRILVILASPRGFQTLNLEEERRRLEKAFGVRPGEIDPDFLEHATLDGLRAKLRSRPFHVLHFMGHGGWSPQTGEGSLLFETADGNRDLVGGSLLADSIKGTSMPVLAVLNACGTARSSMVEGASPFGGVAAALVRKGTPAVIAMQFPITDNAAIPFASELYTRIVAGDPVDSAVTDGRLAIRAALRDSMEWATPVLFMRSPDGRLFAAERPEEQSQPALPNPKEAPASAPPTPGPGLSIGGIQAANVNIAQRDLHIKGKG